MLFVTFLVFFKLPNGDPALRFAGKSPTDGAASARSDTRLHLDKPFYVEFGYFVKHFVTGDENGWPGLGYSYGNYVAGEEPDHAARAANAVADRRRRDALARRSASLIGVLSAVKRRTLIDRLAMGFALFGISAPVFWLGLMALWIFWRKLALDRRHRLHRRSPTASARWFSHLILPWCVLALLYMAIYARMTRNNLLETLGEDYIRTARAKGLSERARDLQARPAREPDADRDDVRPRHRAARRRRDHHRVGLQPPGARLAGDQRARSTRICRPCSAVVLCTATAVAIMNLVVDIVYAFLDPRVRYA